MSAESSARPPRLVIAIDKFRTTATSHELTQVIADVAVRLGWIVDAVPTADGGEGLLDIFGGPNRTARVSGPLGAPVEAAWYDDESGLAVIESARASGLELAGGKQKNDPWAATSAGTGQLICAARSAGAERIVVGLGGSACTDGGRGAIDVLAAAMIDDPGLGSALTVCHDVTTRFLDAAAVFAPQKGADPSVVDRLASRLHVERQRLTDQFGVDPQGRVGGGAAGGLAGALACAGATLVSGFEYVAQVTGLSAVIHGADLVITGEGRLDATSFDGKVVGGVAALAAEAGVRVVAMVGVADPETRPPFTVISLTERFGPHAALERTTTSVRRAAAEILSPLSSSLETQ
jgi:glycerate kinase